MSRSVLAPATGRVIALADAPDPVFAAEMMGSGLAIDPSGERSAAVAPIDGKLVKVMPHAFVISGDDGAVLVHLGIDTVKLDGEGFEVLVEEGRSVQAGAEVITWSPADIADRGLSPLVLLCVLDTPAHLVDAAVGPAQVTAGDPLFDLPLGS